MPDSALLEFSQPRRTAHQFVRETLRRAILTGALDGGTRLVQADIAAQLEVSTTPVREALRDLAADGLIHFDPHRGAIVRELDMTELVELYDIRKALESLAVRKAAVEITEAQLKSATELQDRMDRESDVGLWVQLNSEFHSMLYRASMSPRLFSLVESVQDAATIYVAHSLAVSPGRIKDGNREHRSLITALRKRDGEKAATILQSHLDATLQTIVSANSTETADPEPAPKRPRSSSRR